MVKTNVGHKNTIDLKKISSTVDLLTKLTCATSSIEMKKSIIKTYKAAMFAKTYWKKSEQKTASHYKQLVGEDTKITRSEK